MNAEFFFFLADGKSRRAFRDDERGNSLLAFFRLRIDVENHGVGLAAIGDPCFRAVDDVAVALEDGFGAQRGGIRAGLRLGETVAADFFAAREGDEEFFLLFFGSEAMNRIAVKRILDGENHARRGTNARDFFHHDGVAHVVHAGATVIFRDGNGGEPELGGFAKGFVREAAGLVDFARQRLHFRFGKFAHSFLQQLLLFAEFEIQWTTPRNRSGK